MTKPELTGVAKEVADGVYAGVTFPMKSTIETLSKDVVGLAQQMARLTLQIEKLTDEMKK